MKKLLNKIIKKLFGKKIPKGKYIEPRIETDTKCDKCEYLEDCKAENIVIDCTSCENTRSHYIVGIGSCCKKVCYVEIKRGKDLPDGEKCMIEI